MTTTFDSNNIAEVQLIYATKVKPSDRPKISNSRDSYEILKQTWNHDTIELREEMKLLLLNTANRVLGIYIVSQGGVTGTHADPRLIFSAALAAKATSIILCHNHPSGNLQPSQSDIHLTKQCKQAGDLLEIKVIDHMILSSEGYYSFADEGMI